VAMADLHRGSLTLISQGTRFCPQLIKGYSYGNIGLNWSVSRTVKTD